MPEIKVLILGCGNIGAGYDLHQETTIHTHAKAFSKYKNIDLTVTDTDKQKATVAAKQYHARVVDLDKINFKEFSIVSIATPTSTHFQYLNKLLNLDTQVVICEKPIAATLVELAVLKLKYSKSKSKILVNYMRRFLPGSALLKKRIQKILKKESLSQVIIRYNRGLLNNGTHAIDLLEFLFDTEFKFEKFIAESWLVGAFDGDPSVIGKCKFGKAIVHFEGKAEAVFEIEFLFKTSKIVVKDRGDIIHYFQSKKKNIFEENIGMRQTNLLTSYMKPVIAKALQLQRNRKEKDNFLQALNLNKRAIKVIKKINANE